MEKISNAIPDGISVDDINDPDNVSNLNCASYIEKRLN